MRSFFKICLMAHQFLKKQFNICRKLGKKIDTALIFVN